MTKSQFMNTLKANLTGFSTKEIEEILYDYEEHFNIGLSSGKTEEEIIEELGDPIVTAKQYVDSRTPSRDIVSYKDTSNNNGSNEKSESKSATPKSTSSDDRVLAIILLVILILFATGPILGVLGCIFGIFAASIALIIAGFAMIVGGIAGSIPSFIVLPIASIPLFILIFVGLGTIALGGLIFMVMLWLSKLIFSSLGKLFRWFKERL